MVKPIYQPSGRAAEYGEWAINIYTGCNHRCQYPCYAPRVLHISPEQFFSHVEPRSGIIEATEKQLKKGGFDGKTIHLCFLCDPYPAEIDTTATREIIKLIKATGAHVQILTKGGDRARRDFDLLDRNDWFGVTLTSSNAPANAKREPGAAPFLERFYSLKAAHDLGIKTWVSFEPVYETSMVTMMLMEEGWIDLFRIGKLNYHPSDIDWKTFGLRCDQIRRQYGRNVYIKEDLRKEMM